MIKNYAFFLPQFHSTPENDKYWGKGFTEWINVKKGVPLFDGHEQPKEPLNGYYDLTTSGEMEDQLDRCLDAGLDGVIYWHYFFNKNKQTLNEVPNIHKDSNHRAEFSFAWANSSWTMSWKGDDRTVIFEQEYDIESIESHADYLASYMMDARYTRIGDKPVLYLLNCSSIRTVEYLNLLVHQLGQSQGIEIILGLADHISHWSFDCETFYFHYPPGSVLRQSWKFKLFHSLGSFVSGLGPLRISANLYNRLLIRYLNNSKKDVVPTFLTGWDNTPRYGRKGYIITGRSISQFVSDQKTLWTDSHIKSNLGIVLWKSWNEWAEGNIMEGYEFRNKTFEPLSILNSD